MLSRIAIARAAMLPNGHKRTISKLCINAGHAHRTLALSSANRTMKLSHSMALAIGIGSVVLSAQSQQINKCQLPNGKVQYQNSPCETGTATAVRTFETHSMRLPQMSASSVLELIDTANTEVDGIRRGGAITKAEEAVAQYKSAKLADATAAAEREVGVTELSKQLAEAERLDRADPQYGRFRADSPATASVRNSLTQARSQVDATAARKLQSDREYVQVMARYNSMTRR